MYDDRDSVSRTIDWLTVLLFAICVIAGWLNIFAAVYDPEAKQNIFSMSLNSGRQLLWIGCAVFIILVILLLDYKFYEFFAYIIYGVVLIALIGVLALARDVNGAKSWFEIGSIRIQPSEFAKFATALALAKYMGRVGVRFDQLRTQITCAILLGVPALLILIQNDTGSTMVFSAFILVLYREGLTPWVLILGAFAIFVFVLALIVPQLYLVLGIAAVGLIVIGLTPKKTFKNIALVLAGCLLIAGVAIGVDKIVNDVMLPHQRARIMVLFDPMVDLHGVGWQVIQSKIAIGSGGLAGKGFLEGTQTKLNYVPEQSTDFIFCTIGEEHGWIGSLIIISLFIGLFCRIIYLAERQKDRFARIYGYSVASIIFIHFFVNIGMAIGLLPVIGIPLPFFSYGGSSLWSFTILLFIFLKLDAHRNQMTARY
ncbi:rod shape-determining protein RodA [Rhodocytophaga aerolata]|uniref:Cell wall polymerase n=1 Tax=Rhodocytophaga aerolata TaxID=455078 RepID=A0ABT8R8W4_9BACT|nr:rod shape-determining protein RodA [Rhodocytophaga aerolata]MDO1448531.1 rod shape-determining protein RodA [Rhodocytophaga aerolata]